MTNTLVKQRCSEIYNDIYLKTFRIHRATPIKGGKTNSAETIAQKKAILTAFMTVVKEFPDIEAAEIWKYVYEIHVHRKSGIDDSDVIGKVISADQSWKKSSGHAFEEAIKLIASEALEPYGIEIILQKDLSALIQDNEIANEPRDISWLKEQIKGSVFDLYAIYKEDGKNYCFGCIQSKTSIRDRVTRDREPSIHAMKSYFWSIAIVLDGDFLKNQKFIDMVNGGTSGYDENGWHGMYVFSEKYTNGRIYSTDINFKNLIEHAKKAAYDWRHQRQWFNPSWLA